MTSKRTSGILSVIYFIFIFGGASVMFYQGRPVVMTLGLLTVAGLLGFGYLWQWKFKNDFSGIKILEQTFGNVVIQNAAVVACIWDVEGNLIRFNKYGSDITGFEEAELLGERWKGKLFGEEGIKALESFIHMAEDLECSQQQEFTIFDKNENVLTLIWNFKSIFNEASKRFMIVSFGIDITERKAMEGRLWESYNEMEAVYKELFYTNERLKQSCEELKVAYRCAEEAKNAKNAFLANMSHEIRTPMNGITAMVQMLEQTSLSQEQAELVTMLKKSSLHFTEIINDLLDISIIDAGKLRLELKPVNLRKMIAEAAQLFTGKIEDKNLSGSIIIDERIPPSLYCDELKIKHVITNLMSNALKYTRQGRIDLLATLAEDNGCEVLINFEVKDTGIGISEDKLSMIFDCFTQGDLSYAKKYGGTGLGITISKKLVELMHGNIMVRSREEEGSSFSFSIPMKKGDEVQSEKNDMEHRMEAEGDFFKCRVLVAEDDEVARVFVANLLNRMQFECIFAENGEEAVERYKNESFDLILMDIQMPKMDGLEATRMIRELEEAEGGHIPIIATSAYVLKNEIDKMYEAGVDDTIQKPIHVNVFFDKIEKWSQRVYT